MKYSTFFVILFTCTAVYSSYKFLVKRDKPKQMKSFELLETHNKNLITFANECGTKKKSELNYLISARDKDYRNTHEQLDEPLDLSTKKRNNEQFIKKTHFFYDETDNQKSGNSYCATAHNYYDCDPQSTNVFSTKNKKRRTDENMNNIVVQKRPADTNVPTAKNLKPSSTNTAAEPALPTNCIRTAHKNFHLGIEKYNTKVIYILLLELFKNIFYYRNNITRFFYCLNRNLYENELAGEVQTEILANFKLIALQFITNEEHEIKCENIFNYFAEYKKLKNDEKTLKNLHKSNIDTYVISNSKEYKNILFYNNSLVKSFAVKIKKTKFNCIYSFAKKHLGNEFYATLYYDMFVQVLKPLINISFYYDKKLKKNFSSVSTSSTSR